MKNFVLALGLLTAFTLGCGGMEGEASLENHQAGTTASLMQSTNDAPMASDGAAIENMSRQEQNVTREETPQQWCNDPHADGTCYSQANCQRICGSPGFLCWPFTNCCYCE